MLTSARCNVNGKPNLAASSNNGKNFLPSNVGSPLNSTPTMTGEATETEKLESNIKLSN